MAKILELEPEDPVVKSPFLNYVWLIVANIVWIFNMPLAIWQKLFNTRPVEGCDPEPEQLTVAIRDGNWMDNYYHDNEYLEDLMSREGSSLVTRVTSYSSVASIVDVFKLLGRQFKHVYTGFNVSSQTPASTAHFSHVAMANLLQSPKRATHTPSSRHQSMMGQLKRLQDNGEFEAFDVLSSDILSYCGNESADITVAVLIEQSRCMLYRNRIPRAKYLARTSLELATSTACPAMYIARACLVLSTCYRRKGKLGKAKSFLDKAWQNLITTEYYEDWCRYYDAYGSYFNGLSDTLTLPGEQVQEGAKECFFKQLQAADCGETLKNQQFHALLKLARTLLDANTVFGQQREIPAKDVEKAGEYLDTIESEYWDEVARGMHAQVLLIRVKQYYRQQRWSKAVALLEKCIAMMTGLDYGRDRGLMEDGLKILKLKVEQQRSEIFEAEKGIHEFGSTNESHAESFDSASDSVGVFDSDFCDSC